MADYDGPRTEALMNEQMLFGTGKYEDWARFFPSLRDDLLFVIDDSWNVFAGSSFDHHGWAR